MQTNHMGWLESDGRWVGTVLHLPGGAEVRGAVLLVPSAGRESLTSYRAVRALACRLVDDGYAVLRLDLPGEGESFGLDPEWDLGRVWPAAVSSAAQALHELVPGAPVHAVGVRVGASILAAAQGIDGMRVAMDPLTGERWLRRERALRRFGLSMPSKKPGTELLGLHLTQAQARQVKNLRIDTSADGWVVVAATGAEEHFATTEPHYAERPDIMIEAVRQALPGGTPRPLGAWRPTEILQIAGPGGIARHERVSIGGRALPGVLSSSPDRDPLSAVLFTSGGGEPMAGPGGLWVQVAHEAASYGAVCLRVDRRGTGELSDPADRHEPNPYDPRAIEDIIAAAADLRSRTGLQVLAVGLCIAGWFYAHASRAADFRRVVVFNPQAWQPDVGYYVKLLQRMEVMFRLREHSDVENQADAADFTPGLWTRVRRALKAPAAAVWRRVPTPLWKVLARRGITEYPAMLWEVADPAVLFEFHLGPEDGRVFDESHGPAAMAEVRAGGALVEVHRSDHLDHGLLSDTGRQVARSVLLRHAAAQGEVPL